MRARRVLGSLHIKTEYDAGMDVKSRLRAQNLSLAVSLAYFM
jgi:hypothetical protein